MELRGFEPLTPCLQTIDEAVRPCLLMFAWLAEARCRAQRTDRTMADVRGMCDRSV